MNTTAFNNENVINTLSILMDHVDQDSDIHRGLKDALGMLNNDKINYGRDEFMGFFRSDDFSEQMSADDCTEVFSQVLKGSSDFTKELLISAASDYDVDINAVLGLDNYEMIAEENKHFGQFLESLGYTEQQISDIANSGNFTKNTPVTSGNENSFNANKYTDEELIKMEFEGAGVVVTDESIEMAIDELNSGLTVAEVVSETIAYMASKASNGTTLEDAVAAVNNTPSQNLKQ